MDDYQNIKTVVLDEDGDEIIDDGDNDDESWLLWWFRGWWWDKERRTRRSRRQFHDGRNISTESSTSETTSRSIARTDFKDVLVVTILTLIYFIRPIHILIVSLPMLYHWYNDEPIVPFYLLPGFLVASVLSVVSMILPVQEHPSPLWTMLLLGRVLNYFPVVDEIQENSPVNVNESIKADGKRYIFACQPHGVVPFAGIAWTVRQAQRSQLQPIRQKPAKKQQQQLERKRDVVESNDQSSVQPSVSEMIPTVMASTVLMTPILKHTCGMLGCVSIRQMKERLSSSQSLPMQPTSSQSVGTSLKVNTEPSIIQRTNKRSAPPSSSGLSTTYAPSTSCVRLYVGSATDIFYCNQKVETIELSKRKKFIQVAMQTGADIIPCFEFGNSTVFNVWENSWVLIQISKIVQFPVTYVWGRYLLPVPKRRKLLIVTGQPLGLPYLKRPRPRQVDEYHRKYCDEVKRLFETYKGRVPDYKHKKLVIT